MQYTDDLPCNLRRSPLLVPSRGQARDYARVKGIATGIVSFGDRPRRVVTSDWIGACIQHERLVDIAEGWTSVYQDLATTQSGSSTAPARPSRSRLEIRPQDRERLDRIVIGVQLYDFPQKPTYAGLYRYLAQTPAEQASHNIHQLHQPAAL